MSHAQLDVDPRNGIPFAKLSSLCEKINHLSDLIIFWCSLGRRTTSKHKQVERILFLTDDYLVVGLKKDSNFESDIIVKRCIPVVGIESITHNRSQILIHPSVGGDRGPDLLFTVIPGTGDDVSAFLATVQKVYHYLKPNGSEIKLFERQNIDSKKDGVLTKQRGWTPSKPHLKTKRALAEAISNSQIKQQLEKMRLEISTKLTAQKTLADQLIDKERAIQQLGVITAKQESEFKLLMQQKEGEKRKIQEELEYTHSKFEELRNLQQGTPSEEELKSIRQHNESLRNTVDYLKRDLMELKKDDKVIEVVRLDNSADVESLKRKSQEAEEQLHKTTTALQQTERELQKELREHRQHATELHKKLEEQDLQLRQFKLKNEPLEGDMRALMKEKEDKIADLNRKLELLMKQSEASPTKDEFVYLKLQLEKKDQQLAQTKLMLKSTFKKQVDELEGIRKQFMQYDDQIVNYLQKTNSSTATTSQTINNSGSPIPLSELYDGSPANVSHQSPIRFDVRPPIPPSAMKHPTIASERHVSLSSERHVSQPPPPNDFVIPHPSRSFTPISQNRGTPSALVTRGMHH